MNYQVLARKYRPQNFTEIVGQEHVVQALVNGLENNRLHHAFLFTGTRGVGKTTLARVLAKALNCLEGVSGNPCGVCQHCEEIKNGEFIDLIEVDAASRTGVDDTRSLLENVQYAANKGQYKIYLIDEVHMFSKSSFNALLKTLEEPPEHVKFLLATTEPDKLPVTVLSRCLQFNLKRLTQKQIGDHLASLLQQENVKYDDKALQLIARVADGSMRDGLSLLDQSLAFGAGQVQYDEIRSMLGTIEQSHVTELLKLITEHDHEATVNKLEWINDMSVDYAQLLEDFCLLLHEVALIQTLGKVSGGSHFDVADLKSFAREVSAENIQWYYQLVVKALEQIKFTPSKKISFEMAIIRMLAFVDGSGGGAVVDTSADTKVASSQTITKTAQNVEAPLSGPKSAKELLQNLESTPKKHAASRVKQPIVAEINTATKPDTDVLPLPNEPEHKQAAGAFITAPEQAQAKYDLPQLNAANWEQIYKSLPLKGTARELARNVELLENSQKVITFAVNEASSNFLTDSAQQAFKDELLVGYADYSINIVIQQKVDSIASKLAAEAAKKTHDNETLDPVVASLKHQFGATIIQNKLGD